ncbi:MAG: McrB family protein [Candidatus Cryptobacteroides sp.]
MAFFSKETILASYTVLSKLSPDPASQGATQRISAIRYFVALDMFYKQNNRACDTTKANDASEYINNVGRVVSIDHNCYTSNFYTSIGTNADYSVGSNFFSVNVVNLSKSNTSETYHFPRRGSNPLIDVKAGKLYEVEDYFDNLDYFISDAKHKSAFIIWLLRNSEIDEGNIYDSIQKQIKSMLTDSLSAVLLPSEVEFAQYQADNRVDFSDRQAILSQDDVLSLFEHTKAVIVNNKYSDLLLMKKNLILTGAPGTGKTFTAKAIAADIISNGKQNWSNLSAEQKSQVAFVQFHPSYDYTDFVEGLRPVPGGDFKRQDGVFKAFCKKALGEDSIVSGSNGNLFDKVYSELVDCIRNGEIKKYERITGEDKGVAINEKGLIVYKPEDTSPKTESIRNMRLLFDYYVNNNQFKIEKTERKQMYEIISNLTGGKTNGLDFTEYMWTLNQLFSRIKKEDIKQLSQTPEQYKEQQSKKPYIFIIDEINRGELSKIFGELFYAIEPDYRGEEGTVQTQYNNLVEDDDIFKSGFYVPENVYIIGTMNDVDRGVEAMDFAIRRRFGWKEVTAEESAENMGITGLAKAKMDALNKALIEQGLTKAHCIGGAYFRKLEGDDFKALWDYHLEGIIFEYFRGEPDAQTKIDNIKKAYDDAKLPEKAQEGEESVSTEENSAE